METMNLTVIKSAGKKYGNIYSLSYGKKGKVYLFTNERLFDGLMGNYLK